MRIFLILFFLASFISCSKEGIEQSMIKADVTFLADDQLEGRQTGTQGEIKAAAYIANRFKKLGLTEKGTDGFYQEFSFVQKQIHIRRLSLQKQRWNNFRKKCGWIYK